MIELGGNLATVVIVFILMAALTLDSFFKNKNKE